MAAQMGKQDVDRTINVERARAEADQVTRAASSGARHTKFGSAYDMRDCGSERSAAALSRGEAASRIFSR